VEFYEGLTEFLQTPIVAFDSEFTLFFQNHAAQEWLNTTSSHINTSLLDVLPGSPEQKQDFVDAIGETGIGDASRSVVIDNRRIDIKQFPQSEPPRFLLLACPSGSDLDKSCW